MGGSQGTHPISAVPGKWCGAKKEADLSAGFLLTGRLRYGVVVVSRLVVSGSNESVVVVAPTDVPTDGNVDAGGVANAPAVAPAAES